jgi:hypothetical protein
MWLMLKGRGLFEIHKPIARGVYFTQMLSFLVDKIELKLVRNISAYFTCSETQVKQILPALEDFHLIYSIQIY